MFASYKLKNNPPRRQHLGLVYYNKLKVPVLDFSDSHAHQQACQTLALTLFKFL